MLNINLQKGVFSAPTDGEIVATDIPYTLTWETTLLKYFVNGEGAEPGYEMVSENVTLFVTDGIDGKRRAIPL